MWRCLSCGVLRLWPSPGDVSDLYPEDYYSYRTASSAGDSRIRARVMGVRRSLLALTWRASFSSSRLLGTAASIASQRSSTLSELRMYMTRPSATLLDVGCGAGEFLSWARAMGLRVRGLELDAAVAQRVRHLGIECDYGGVQSLSQDHRRYDVVRMSHVVEHMEDPIESLQLVRDRLAPGGATVLMVPNAGGAVSHNFGSDWLGLDPPRHLWGFTPTSLTNIVARAGLETVSLRTSTQPTALYQSFRLAEQTLNHEPLPERPSRCSLRSVARLAHAIDRTGEGDSILLLARRS